MKRHESLAPLSREHHGALILAQLIKANAPAYKGLPTTIAGKVEYAIQFYKTDLDGHFKKEEAMLDKVRPVHPSVAVLADEIKTEHRILQKLFLSLKDTPNRESVLNELGNMLDAHIRKEERVLFPLIQEHCPETLLNELLPLLL